MLSPAQTPMMWLLAPLGVKDKVSTAQRGWPLPWVSWVCTPSRAGDRDLTWLIRVGCIEPHRLCLTLCPHLPIPRPRRQAMPEELGQQQAAVIVILWKSSRLLRKHLTYFLAVHLGQPGPQGWRSTPLCAVATGPRLWRFWWRATLQLPACSTVPQPPWMSCSLPLNLRLPGKEYHGPWHVPPHPPPLFPMSTAKPELPIGVMGLGPFLPQFRSPFLQEDFLLFCCFSP